MPVHDCGWEFRLVVGTEQEMICRVRLSDRVLYEVGLKSLSMGLSEEWEGSARAQEKSTTGTGVSTKYGVGPHINGVK
jgi:hypothetical protein